MVYRKFVLLAVICQSLVPTTGNPPSTSLSEPATTTPSSTMIVVRSQNISACPEGYEPRGPVCSQKCPPGFKDNGMAVLYCQMEHGLTYGRGGGYAWRGKDGFSDTGMINRCERDQGLGNCEKSGAIYYPKCKPGYSPSGCCICRAIKPNCQALGLGENIFDASCRKKIVEKIDG
jgi:hypothetical protein